MPVSGPETPAGFSTVNATYNEKDVHR
jgi:hypothetical protein